MFSTRDHSTKGLIHYNSHVRLYLVRLIFNLINLNYFVIGFKFHHLSIFVQVLIIPKIDYSRNYHLPFKFNLP